MDGCPEQDVTKRVADVLEETSMFLGACSNYRCCKSKTSGEGL
jgi:hypothetical protein